ncbi:MAG: aminotransferase class III-fold pyridoxal phosphate-dependent enzyme [Kofleriaceae bacterium]
MFDEVQVGFGLGGPFAWHSKFRLLNGRGQPDYPDAVTFAKRAQVGVVMSRFEDPEPSSAHGASLVRGRIHAEMMSTGHNAARIENLVTPRLAAIAQAFPHLVGSPRACGYAFAFDLPTAEHQAAYLGQRFWRGAVVFGAGARTVRYRLSDSFLAREVELLFETIRRSLAWLDAHPGRQPPAWDDVAAPFAIAPRPDRDAVVLPELRYRYVPHTEAMVLLPPILDIEYQVYEPARRTPPAEIKAALADPEGTTVVAEAALPGGGWQLVGFALGAPLENSGDAEGLVEDPMQGKHNTLYSASITVSPTWQGAGLGRRLKEMQLRDAAARTRADGTPRYRYVTGRNRVGRTAQMTHLNRVFGAHVVSVLTGQYEDPEGQAIYYRIPLGPIAPDLAVVADRAAARRAASEGGAEVQHDLARGLVRPLAEVPASLRAAERTGQLYGPTVNKLTLMNYATPAMVRAIEWVGALTPELPHLYLTSSRDEAVDKALRLLRCTRAKAQVAIGLDGGYLGHTIASTRSLSDPGTHAGGPGTFAWPRIPHPAEVGTARAIEALRAAIAAAGGADAVLGFVYEPVQERTGRALPADFGAALAALRTELGVPLVACEVASACYRGGDGPFAYPQVGVVPDVLAWWAGGQTGYVHCAARWFVGAPLTLVSTWDGDELSLIRTHHALRAARGLDLAAGAAALREAMARATTLRTSVAGLYGVIEAGERAAVVDAALLARGVRARRLPGGRLAVAPPLDRAVAAAEALGRALAEVG